MIPYIFGQTSRRT